MNRTKGLQQDTETLQPNTSHGRHMTVGTLQGFAAFSLSLPTGLLTAAFLSRYLGPENYGLLTVVSSIVVWVEGAITMGFGRTAIKFVAGAEDWRSVSTKFLQAQLLVSLITVLVLLLIAPVLASGLKNNEVTGYLRLLVLGIPFTALFLIHQSILIGRGFFGSRALITATYWISRMIFIFLFVWIWPSVYSAILGLISPYILGLIGSRFIINPKITGHSDFPIRHVWSFALPLFFYAIAISLFNRMDLFFVKGLIEDPHAAGFYSASQNLVLIPSLFLTSISPLLLSKMTLLYITGKKASARLMIRNALRLTFAALPLAGVAAGMAGELVSLIYGPAFFPAGPILRILIFSAIGLSLIIVSTSAILTANRPELTFRLILPVVISSFFVYAIIIPRFGSTGAAGVTTVLSWIGAVGFIIAVYQLWQTGIPWGTVIRSIVISIPAYALAFSWHATGFMVLLKLPVLSALVIAAFLLSGECRADEIAFLCSVFQGKKRKHPLKEKEVE